MPITLVTHTDCTTLEDRRKHVRIDVNEPAYIFGDGSSTRCVLVNLSSDGAAIDVPDASYIPSTFSLMTERDRVVRNCQVVWVQQNRLGLIFKRTNAPIRASGPVIDDARALEVYRSIV
jgi:hypothetical protein